MPLPSDTWSRIRPLTTHLGGHLLPGLHRPSTDASCDRLPLADKKLSLVGSYSIWLDVRWKQTPITLSEITPMRWLGVRFQPSTLSMIRWRVDTVQQGRNE
jgi:hypothetical protein